jgi:hypothetical protein
MTLITITHAARALHVHEDDLAGEIRAGKLPSTSVGSTTLVDFELITSMLAERARVGEPMPAPSAKAEIMNRHSRRRKRTR